MKLDLECVEIKDMDVVMFADYGIINRQFTICTKHKYGRLEEVLIYPTYNTDQKLDRYVYFKSVIGIKKELYITGYGTPNPQIDTFNWCKEHKCLLLGVWVALDTNAFIVEWFSFRASIGFMNRNKRGV